METLVNNLTQKDEVKALSAAQTLINQKDIDSFRQLCEKSAFLFDFVKENVRKRIKKAITKENFKNITAFFSVYDENYSDLFAMILAEYATEDLSDEMYELLESGTLSEKQYAAKYFAYIPDTIAQDKLEEYAFGTDETLAINAAKALGEMKDEQAYNTAISKLASDDDFEVMSAVKFLTTFGNKSALDKLLPLLETSPMNENIAGEIPYLMPVTDMLETKPQNQVLTCVDLLLEGLGEILPLVSVFDYEIFEALEYLINKAQNNQDSQIASVLLRALEKFSTLMSNEEYIFDEQKDTKQEIKAISELLNAQSKDFWTQQELLISEEFSKTTYRISSALEITKALEIKSVTKALINLIESEQNETILVNALGTAKALAITNTLDREKVLTKITDQTLNAIASSYFA